MRTAVLCAAVASSVVAVPGPVLAGGGTASFQGLGRLPGGPQPFSGSDGVSANGSVVAGFSNSAPGYQATCWTQAGGLVGLGDLAGSIFDSRALGVSADGSIAVGHATGAEGFQAVRFQSGQILGLGDLPGGVFSSEAIGVSADGGTIVGRGNSAGGDEAFRWRAGVMTGLGCLGQTPQGHLYSSASDCSADGELVVGASSSGQGFQAFRWTSAGGMVGLGDLSGGAFTSSAAAVSRDGSTIVGYGTSSIGMQPCVWRNGGPAVALGGGPTGPGQVSTAAAVNADGSVIVGTAIGYGAFVWDAAQGMRSLQTLLTGTYGLDLTGWTLTDAMAVSDDGLVIAGTGWHVTAVGGPGYEAFVVAIPAPATMVGFIGAAGVVVAGRRRGRPRCGSG